MCPLAPGGLLVGMLSIGQLFRSEAFPHLLDALLRLGEPRMSSFGLGRPGLPVLPGGGLGPALTPVLSFQIGFTSAPGQGGILAQREFDRRFSPHFVSSALSSPSLPGSLSVVGPPGLLRRSFGSRHTCFLRSDSATTECPH